MCLRLSEGRWGHLFTAPVIEFSSGRPTNTFFFLARRKSTSTLQHQQLFMILNLRMLSGSSCLLCDVTFFVWLFFVFFFNLSSQSSCRINNPRKGRPSEQQHKTDKLETSFWRRTWQTGHIWAYKGLLGTCKTTFSQRKLRDKVQIQRENSEWINTELNSSQRCGSNWNIALHLGFFLSKCVFCCSVDCQRKTHWLRMFARCFVFGWSVRLLTEWRPSLSACLPEFPGPILGEASPLPTHRAGVERGMWCSQHCHSSASRGPLQPRTAAVHRHKSCCGCCFGQKRWSCSFSAVNIKVYLKQMKNLQLLAAEYNLRYDIDTEDNWVCSIYWNINNNKSWQECSLFFEQGLTRWRTIHKWAVVGIYNSHKIYLCCVCLLYMHEFIIIIISFICWLQNMCLRR